MNLPPALNHQKILESYGWKIECESPYEISHLDGSKATLNAAKIVELALIQEYINNLANAPNLLSQYIPKGADEF